MANQRCTHQASMIALIVSCQIVRSLYERALYPSCRHSIMLPTSRCEPLLVNTASPDRQGCLILVDDQLVAIIVRIERTEHLEPELWERWFLEAGFGPCQAPTLNSSFASPAEALDWACRQVEQRAREALTWN